MSNPSSMPAPPEDDPAAHWDRAYRERGDDVSWFEAEPVVSLSMFDRCGVTVDRSVVDVGGGSSRLVDQLLARGHRDVTVVDLSGEALIRAAARAEAAAAAVPTAGGPAPAVVSWVRADVLGWRPARQFEVWHDRAALHFVTGAAEQARYAAVVRRCVAPEGLVVLATFAPDGPQQCSGLPVHRHDAHSLARLLGAGFVLIHQERLEHTTPWGAVQPFTWAAFRREGGSPQS